MSWVGFSLMTGIIISWVFTAVGGVQMLQWAQMKHKAYVLQYLPTFLIMHYVYLYPAEAIEWITDDGWDVVHSICVIGDYQIHQTIWR